MKQDQPKTVLTLAIRGASASILATYPEMSGAIPAGIDDEK